jgi:hypothetical protein
MAGLHKWRDDHRTEITITCLILGAVAGLVVAKVTFDEVAAAWTQAILSAAAIYAGFAIQKVQREREFVESVQREMRLVVTMYDAGTSLVEQVMEADTGSSPYEPLLASLKEQLNGEVTLIENIDVMSLRSAATAERIINLRRLLRTTIQALEVAGARNIRITSSHLAPVLSEMRQEQEKVVGALATPSRTVGTGT